MFFECHSSEISVRHPFRAEFRPIRDSFRLETTLSDEQQALRIFQRGENYSIERGRWNACSSASNVLEFIYVYIRGTSELLHKVHMASTLEPAWKRAIARRGERERENESTEQREHLPGMHSALIALSASRSYTLVRAEPLKRPPLHPLPSSPTMVTHHKGVFYTGEVNTYTYKYTYSGYIAVEWAVTNLGGNKGGFLRVGIVESVDTHDSFMRWLLIIGDNLEKERNVR